MRASTRTQRRIYWHPTGRTTEIERDLSGSESVERCLYDKAGLRDSKSVVKRTVDFRA
jgi:hypothetical protein